MAQSPSTDNYTLGKGVVYFDQKDATSGLYLGSRDLGNAPEFSFNIALEKLEHFSSRGGLKAKDKQVISQITPGCKFTLDEVNKENMALLTLADTASISQAAAAVSDEELVFKGDMRQDLAKRNIGLYSLAYTAASGTVPSRGDSVTGATGAGTVVSATGDGTAGTMVILLTTAGFVDAESITTANLTTAVANGVETWIPGVVDLSTTAALGGTALAAGTDYSISTTLKDHTIGRVLFDSGSATAEDTTVYATYNCAAVDYTEVRAFKQTSLEGKLRFVSDNPVGGQQELTIWRCNLTPAGDTAMIGEDWSTLSFEGEILKDESNTDSPYMTITV